MVYGKLDRNSTTHRGPIPNTPFSIPVQGSLVALFSSVDPTLCGKGLVVLASSAFLFSRKPIRLQLYNFHVTLHPIAKQRNTRSTVSLTNQNVAL